MEEESLHAVTFMESGNWKNQRKKALPLKVNISKTYPNNIDPIFPS